jgi:type II secretory pathway pseudopilin PulG
VNERQTNLKARRGGDQARGFSMIEVVVVIAVAMTIAGIAIIQVRPALQQIQANTAKDEIQSSLRRARELAISDRRNVQVEFLTNPAGNPAGSYVRLTRKGVGTADVILLMLAIQNSVVYTTYVGEPDTPDGYGNAAPVYFGGVANGPPAGMVYQSDGTFVVNGIGTPINGTVFLGIPGQPSTARAVTVLGTTGRVRSYHISGASWFD